MFKNCLNAVVILLICLSLNVGISYAQPAISLKDVKKIEFIESQGGLSGFYKASEIVPDAGIWKLYQIRLHSSGADDSTRTFLKKISSGNVIQLLALILKRDTTINMDLFPINRERLSQQIDSLDMFSNRSLTTDDKGKLRTLIQNPLVIKDALIKAFKPFKMDDESMYTITVTTHTDFVFSVTHRSFANIYNLPWIGNGGKSYDPRISVLINQMVGNDRYEKDAVKSLHSAIIFWIYMGYRDYFKKSP